jgi:murein DD-endopeptidase MepM/ murein hydrolase activator NlpD
MFRITLVALAASAFAVGRWPLAEKTSVPPLSANSQRPTANEIAMPVLGVQPSSLKPTFNEARAGHVHHALDILAPRGTPVVAAVDGTIRKLFNSGAGGITIYQFDGDETMVYYYAHLDRYADGVREGLTVRQGDVIGYVGTTGNAPPGTPHLHFAIARLTPQKEWWKGEPIDPYLILTTPASAPPKLASGTD